MICPSGLNDPSLEGKKVWGVVDVLHFYCFSTGVRSSENVRYKESALVVLQVEETPETDTALLVTRGEESR
jgi:hypothetical protein